MVFFAVLAVLAVSCSDPVEDQAEDAVSLDAVGSDGPGANFPDTGPGADLCNGFESETSPDTLMEGDASELVMTLVLAAEGAILETGDGLFTLVIPPDALVEDTEVNVSIVSGRPCNGPSGSNRRSRLARRNPANPTARDLPVGMGPYIPLSTRDVSLQSEFVCCGHPSPSPYATAIASTNGR